MTKDRILTILRAWHNAMRECDERMDQLAAVAGQVVESPLGDAVYRLGDGPRQRKLPKVQREARHRPLC